MRAYPFVHLVYIKREKFMEKRKVLVIDEKVDVLLTNICDAALKSSGFESLEDINALSDAVCDEPIDEHD